MARAVSAAKYFTFHQYLAVNSFDKGTRYSQER